MTRLAPISARELQAILSRLGFRVVRQKGSHAFWQHEDGRSTIFPVHKGEDIGRGLLRPIPLNCRTLEQSNRRTPFVSSP